MDVKHHVYAGSDTDKYTYLSFKPRGKLQCRGTEGVRLQTILKAAGRTNERTFAKYYKKGHMVESFGQTVLDGFLKK